MPLDNINSFKNKLNRHGNKNNLENNHKKFKRLEK